MERYVVYADGLRIACAETKEKALKLANEYLYNCMNQVDRFCPKIEVQQERLFINDEGELKVSEIIRSNVEEAKKEIKDFAEKRLKEIEDDDFEKEIVKEFDKNRIIRLTAMKED